MLRIIPHQILSQEYTWIKPFSDFSWFFIMCFYLSAQALHALQKNWEKPLNQVQVEVFLLSFEYNLFFFENFQSDLEVYALQIERKILFRFFHV